VAASGAGPPGGGGVASVRHAASITPAIRASGWPGCRAILSHRAINSGDHSAPRSGSGGGAGGLGAREYVGRLMSLGDSSRSTGVMNPPLKGVGLQADSIGL